MSLKQYDCGIEPQGEKGNWEMLTFASASFSTMMYPYKYKKYGHNVPSLALRNFEEFEEDFVKTAVRDNKWIIEGSMYGLYVRQSEKVPMSHQFNSKSEIILELVIHAPKSFVTFYKLKQEDKTRPIFSNNTKFRGMSYQQIGRAVRQGSNQSANQPVTITTPGRQVGKSMLHHYGMKVLNPIKGVLNIDTTA